MDTQTTPEWVSSGSTRKYDRAVAELTKKNAQLKAENRPEVPVTEAALKELYVKWGGLVIGETAADKKADKVVADKAVADKAVTGGKAK